MGAQYKEHGGGPATGLANDFVSFLSQGLNTGTFGAGNPAGGDAFGSTMGIAGVLNDLLSGGAGQAGGNLQTMIGKNVDRQALALRSRFGAGGGTAFGTPAAYAEGMMRAEAAPQIANAVTGLQMQALMPLLQMISGTAQKGISQRQGTMSPNPMASAFGAIAPIAGAALGAFAGPPGMAVGSALGSSLGGAVSGGGGGMSTGSSLASPGAFQWQTPSFFDYGITP